MNSPLRLVLVCSSLLTCITWPSPFHPKSDLNASTIRPRTSLTHCTIYWALSESSLTLRTTFSRGLIFSNAETICPYVHFYVEFLTVAWFISVAPHTHNTPSSSRVMCHHNWAKWDLHEAQVSLSLNIIFNNVHLVITCLIHWWTSGWNVLPLATIIIKSSRRSNVWHLISQLLNCTLRLPKRMAIFN